MSDDNSGSNKASPNPEGTPVATGGFFTPSGNSNTDERVSASRQPTAVRKSGHKVFCMVVLPGCRVVLGGSSSGDVFIVHPHTNEVEKTLTGHNDSVLAMALNHHGLFTGSADKTVRLWSMRDMTCLQLFEGSEGMVSSIMTAPVPGNAVLFTGSDDKILRQWNVETGTIVEEIDEHEAPINACVANATNFFSADSDGVIIAFEMLRKKCVRKVTAHEGGVWALALDPDDGRIFSAGGDGTIKAWRTLVEDDVMLCVMRAHTEMIRGMWLEEDLLCSCGKGGELFAWNIEPNNIQETPMERIYCQTNKGQALAKDLTCMGLQNNELVVVGLERYINRFDVSDLLGREQEEMELPPLTALGDDEEEVLGKLPPQERHTHYLDLDVEEAVAKYRELPVNYLVESLFYKVNSSWLFSEMFIFIPFLIMFLFFFMYELQIMEIFYMNEGVKNMVDTEDIGGFKLPRSFYDVTDSKWWGFWVSNLFIGQMFGGKAATKWWEPVRFQGQNMMAGAIRFRTLRVKNTTCSVNSEFFDFTQMTPVEKAATERCFGEYEFSKSGELVENKPFVCLDPLRCTHDPAAMLASFNETHFSYADHAGAVYRGLEFYSASGYTVDIPMTLSETEASTRVATMISNGFVDDLATRFVIIEWIHYNPELQTWAANKLAAEVFAGGGWYISAKHLPFKVFDASESKFKIFFEVVFFLFILFWFFRYFYALARFYKVYGNMIAYIFDPWNILDLINLGVFFGMFALRWQWYANSASTASVANLPLDVSVYPQKLEDIADQYQLQISANAVNVVLTFFKILKYMSLSDQLNVLTRTMAAAQQSIVGVLILFVYFVFAFAITGMSIYGENVFGFRSLDASYNTLMRWLVGDMDYASLSESHRAVTVFFFWSYIIFAQFMLLNFLIAVLSDAFNEVQQNRLPITLDQAIRRTAQDIKRSFLPHYIRITLILLARRQGRTALTAKQAAFMREHRDSLLSEEALRAKDYDELDFTYISRSFFLENVPKELTNDDNINFMDEVWNDMAWEWHFKLKDRSNSGQHVQQELVDEVLEAELATVRHKLGAVEESAVKVNQLYNKLKPYSASI